jgi:hypothetical protein
MKQPNIHIPVPCHENWDAMRPEEKGRFCATCTKVVRDFTDMPVEAIVQEVKAAPAGSICGRVRPNHSAKQELPAQLWLRFPVGRLRHFLAALVVCFGPHLLGLDAAVAQTVQQKIARAPAQARQLKGTVLDQVSGDPLCAVQIIAQRGEEGGGHAVSDSSGKFTLALKPEFIRGGAYELVISYLGMEKSTYSIPQDITEVGITIDASTHLPEIYISDKGMPSDAHWVGTIQISTVGNICLFQPTENLQKYYYNPLDEWIWMRNSEVIHTGRH